MSSAAARCSSGDALNIDETVQRASFDIERPDRKLRPGIATRHQDHPAALGQQRNRQVEIRLAHGLPPHIHSLGSKLLDSPGHVLLLVIDRQIGPQLPA